jgi:exodeoxyribonuclease (lambda-induced)
MSSDAIFKHAQNIIGVDFSKLEQGSDDWKMVKLGVMSASEAKEILSGSKTETKKTYIAKKIAQIITGVPVDEISAKALQWGKDNEPAARTALEMMKSERITEEGFSFKDISLREGCSVDGRYQLSGEYLEIKCPATTEVYVKMLCFDQIKPEWEKQVQFSMRVLDLDIYNFTIYDPRVIRQKIISKVFERDEKMQSLFDESTQEISSIIDKTLSECGYEFGDQWKDRIEIAKRGIL